MPQVCPPYIQPFSCLRRTINTNVIEPNYNMTIYKRQTWIPVLCH